MRTLAIAALFAVATIGLAGCSRGGETTTTNETVVLNDEGAFAEESGNVADPGVNVFDPALNAQDTPPGNAAAGIGG